MIYARRSPYSREEEQSYRYARTHPVFKNRKQRVVAFVLFALFIIWVSL